MKIGALLFDYDGFITTAQTTDIASILQSERWQIIRSTFLSIIEREQYDYIYLMSGSNRQSYGLDQEGSTSTGAPSSFAVFEALEADLRKYLYEKIKFNKILLADVYGTKEDEESFYLAKYPYQGCHHPGAHIEDNKTNIFYMCAHALGSLHSKENNSIHIHYGDDFLAPLEGLKNMPTNLIPSHVKFSSYHMPVNSLAINYYSSCIQGTGATDFNFRENMRGPILNRAKEIHTQAKNIYDQTHAPGAAALCKNAIQSAFFEYAKTLSYQAPATFYNQQTFFSPLMPNPATSPTFADQYRYQQ